MRHVLAHLVRPGGSVYLVDIDGTAARVLDGDPDLDDPDDAYLQWHRRRGNDLMTGLRLARLLARAGLDVVLHESRYTIARPPPGVRPPSWAARERAGRGGARHRRRRPALGGRLRAHGRRGAAADVLRARLRRARHGTRFPVRTPVPVATPVESPEP